MGALAFDDPTASLAPAERPPARRARGGVLQAGLCDDNAMRLGTTYDSNVDMTSRNNICLLRSRGGGLTHGSNDSGVVSRNSVGLRPRQCLLGYRHRLLVPKHLRLRLLEDCNCWLWLQRHPLSTIAAVVESSDESSKCRPCKTRPQNARGRGGQFSAADRASRTRGCRSRPYPRMAPARARGTTRLWPPRSCPT